MQEEMRTIKGSMPGQSRLDLVLPPNDAQLAASWRAIVMRQLNKKPALRPHQISIAGDGAVRSVDRALALLEFLAEDEVGYRLSDLTDRSGISPSTIHRLLTTLEQRNFVQFNQASGIWYIGRQSFLCRIRVRAPPLKRIRRTGLCQWQLAPVCT